MLDNATNLYRKFGVAERRDLRFRGTLRRRCFSTEIALPIYCTLKAYAAESKGLSLPKETQDAVGRCSEEVAGRELKRSHKL